MTGVFPHACWHLNNVQTALLYTFPLNCCYKFEFLGRSFNLIFSSFAFEKGKERIQLAKISRVSTDFFIHDLSSS